MPGMDFTRTRGPIGDPLLDTVHRRHPDVDIVVLPPETAAPVAAEPVTPVGPDAARSARTATAAEATRLWASMLELEPEAATGAVRQRLAPGRTAGVVVPTALATTTGSTDTGDQPVDRSRALSLLAATLDGWDVRRRPGPVEQLRATRGGAAVRATYAPSTGVVVLEVTGPALAVGDVAAHELVGEDA
jgi:hypothetical protein